MTKLSDDSAAAEAHIDDERKDSINFSAENRVCCSVEHKRDGESSANLEEQQSVLEEVVEGVRQSDTGRRKASGQTRGQVRQTTSDDKQILSGKKLKTNDDDDVDDDDVCLQLDVTQKTVAVGNDDNDAEEREENVVPEKIHRPETIVSNDETGDALAKLIISEPGRGHVRASSDFSEQDQHIHAESKKLKMVASDKLSSSFSSALAEANYLRKRGKFQNAIVLYDKILVSTPCCIDALSGKGVSLRELARDSESMACFEEGIQIAPCDWFVRYNRGMALKKFGLFDDALKTLRYALNLCCDTLDDHIDNVEGESPLDMVKQQIAVVLNELGVRLKLAGSIGASETRYREAIRIRPQHSTSYFNLAVLCSDDNRFDEAEPLYREALKRRPEYPEALSNLGVIMKSCGKLDEAITLYEYALQFSPNFEIARQNLSIALCDRGSNLRLISLDDAIASYKRALVFNSKYVHAWYNLGVAYVDNLRFDDAIVAYETALLVDAKCTEAHHNLGVIFKERGNFLRSIAHYQAALAINNALPQTLSNLSVVFTLMGDRDAAVRCCEQAIAVDSKYSEVWNNWGVLLRDEGRIHEAVAAYERCTLLDLEGIAFNAKQNRLLALNYDSSFDDEFVFVQHVKWGNNEIRRMSAVKAKNSLEDESHVDTVNEKQASTHSRLRVGYISPDFVTHSVSYFIEAPLREASKRVQIFCYSNTGHEDEKTKLLKSFGHVWRNIYGLSAMRIFHLIKRDCIDVLVDLTGHSASNRLDVFALKPAPVQITWIGYPNTTGLRSIDYRITDTIADPLDTSQRFAETLVRVSNSFPFLCYSPPPKFPPIHKLSALTNDFITFGSLNNFAKVTKQVVALWSRVLHRVPHSRMLLKCKPFVSSSVCERVYVMFENFGVKRKRLDLLPLVPRTVDHLKVYWDVDIALDPFPYAGTTTTTECLLMAVPVITLSGNNQAHNVGASLLSHVPGLESCITSTQDQYVDAAANLAADIPALEALHNSLRERFLSSPLCDGIGFTDMIERTFEKLFQRHTLTDCS